MQPTPTFNIDDAERLATFACDANACERRNQEPIMAQVVSHQACSETRPFLERFLSSFFQEKNIKWMLLVGAAIVFGSSLMLVTHQWSHWSSSLKFLAILIYTIAVYAFGEFCHKRLLLHVTAKVMHGLTLLLLPTCFLSLHWLSENAMDGTLSLAATTLLMTVATVVAALLSHAIIRRWLHGSQPTFQVSYLLLCMAGALPRFTTDWMAFTVSVSLWCIATLGIIKVNRHLFWLAEENRWPRVFGFFPISLLSFQLGTLLATKTLSHMPLEWTGMGCVMMALTVFLTARTIANVFRQRTGDLVRPLPWSIVLPLFVGLLLTAVGVCLSFAGFSFVGSTTYAAVPTAVIAAVMLWVAACDTRHRGFVWAALCLLTVAYQCTPTLVADLTTTLKSVAAQGIQESRLPIAFYGLTYLPLILGAAVASRYFETRRVYVFSQPLKQYATFLSLLLWAVSFGHLKAIFLVSFVNVPIFFALAILFRDRRFSIPSIMSLFAAAIVCIPFLNAMEWTSYSMDYIPVVMCGLVLLLTLSRLPDRLVQTIPCPKATGSRLFVNSDGSDIDLVSRITEFLAVGLTAHWLVTSTTQLLNSQEYELLGSTWAYAVLLIGVWGWQTIHIRNYFTGLAIWMIAGIESLHWANHLIATDQLSVWQAMDLGLFGISILCLLCRWLLGCGIFAASGELLVDKRSSIGFSWQRIKLGIYTQADVSHRGTVKHAFLVPLCDVAFVLTLLGIMLLVLPQLVLANVGEWTMQTPLASSAAVAWLLLMAIVFGSLQAALAMGIIMPLWASALATQFLTGPHAVTTVLDWNLGASRMQTILGAWTLTSGVLGLIWQRIPNPAAKLGRNCSLIWMILVFSIGLASFDSVARVLSLIAIAYVYIESKSQFHTDLRRVLAAIACNIQWFYVCFWLSGFHGWIGPSSMPTTDLPGLLTLQICSVAASIVIFDHSWNRTGIPIADAWGAILRLTAVGLSLAVFGVGDFATHLVIAVGVSHIVLAVATFVRAFEKQRELHTWFGLAWVLALLNWLTFHEIVTFSGGSLALILVSSCVVILAFANQNQSERYNVWIRPLRLVALTLPIAVCALTIASQFVEPLRGWNSSHALALFCASGLYFYQSIHTRNRYMAIPALIILNAAILIGWHSIGIHDVQCYLVPIGLSVLTLVELLEKELPRSTHDPLRYIGALSILVSPVFGLMGGSWLHWISLLGLCVLVILIAMGMRLKVLMYTGTAFLIADLTGMVIRSSIDNPTMLWVSGLGIGAAVIALAAYCERRRDVVLAKIRLISSELATWR